MVVAEALHGDPAAAIADELFGGGTGVADFKAFFDHTALEVKGSGIAGEEGEEELEWLSNKDAFPAVETMALAGARPQRKGVRRPRQEAARSPPPRRAPSVARAPAPEWRCRHCGAQKTPQWRGGPEGPATLCNACGVRYRSGHLMPEYRPVSSPTFSTEVHSNRHRRVVELRRRKEGASPGIPAAAGNGEEKGSEKVERLSNEGTLFLRLQTMVAVAARPRTKRVLRPRPEVAWSPLLLPPRAPAAAGQRSSQLGGEAGVAAEQGGVPDGADDGAVADEGHAAFPAVGGVDAAAPRAPAAAAAGQRCQDGGTEKTLVLYRSCRKVSEYLPASRATSPEPRFNLHGRIRLHGEEGNQVPEGPSNKHAFPAVKVMPPARAARPQTKGVWRRCRRGGEEAMAVAQGRAAGPAGGGVAAPAARAAAPRAPAASGTQCRHCGTTETPLWRNGPEGRHTLCNACGVRHRSGRLVPEYRPASSPTFAPGLHSNLHRQVAVLRRRRDHSAEASRAVEAAAADGTTAWGGR